MIKITDKSRLFVWGNSYVIHSGGAEVLNMFCSKMKSLGANVAMFNYGHPDKFQQTDFYKEMYDINCAGTYELEDVEDNIIMYPELMFEGEDFVNSSMNFKHAQIIVWWLGTGFDYADKSIKTSKRKVMDLMKRYRGRMLHLCESELAMRDLLYHGIEERCIFQHPVHSIFYNTPKFCDKTPTVFYNGLKGINKAFVEEQIIPRLPDINFETVSWSNAYKTKAEMCSLYDKSKVYIDFCEFEGREMMPREACLRDCILLLNNRGNAATFDDYPLDDYYKINMYTNPDEIAEKIRYCVYNYDNLISDMSFIKNKFMFEPMKWEWEIENIFHPMLNKV